MKSKDIYALKEGEKVVHKTFGVSTVTHVVPEFGAGIIPDQFRWRLYLWSLSKKHSLFKDFPYGTPFLESTPRMILRMALPEEYEMPLCDCGKPAIDDFNPCCSYDCWSIKYEIDPFNAKK
jgi:hypothetical protein